MREARKSNRIPKRIEAILYIATHSFPIVIRNISTTGLCASIRARIPIGTRCHIIISHRALNITFQGIVVRCKPNEVGIAFQNIRTEHRNVLDTLCE